MEWEREEWVWLVYIKEETTEYKCISLKMYIYIYKMKLCCINDAVYNRF
jgi:hypothetical protein